MTPRLHALPTTRPGRSQRSAPSTERRAADQDRFNNEMTLILREAADERTNRERVRSGEDERRARDETSAMDALIQSRGRRAPAPADHDAENGGRRSGPTR